MRQPFRWFVTGLLALVVVADGSGVKAAEVLPRQVSTSRPEASADVLSGAERVAVDRSVDRALGWIAARQEPSGRFPSVESGQPAITALCVMAFLSRGHLPEEGPYGRQITRAIEYVLDSQNSDGIFARGGPISSPATEIWWTASYNHPISGLMLAEVHGQGTGPMGGRIRPAVEAALRVTLKRHAESKRTAADKGGWRYHRRHQSSDSDLSVTSWELMFLRSCRNAGFDVPAGPIDEALEFVGRCYDPQRQVFWYALRGREHVTTRAMTGAGILSLSLAGRHNTPEARNAAEWLLEHPFDVYLDRVGTVDRYFYGAFYCSHAMFQLGGHYWSAFFPVMSRTLVENQASDGSWAAETGGDAKFGNVYSTAMAVLALSPPYQLLPIFQR
jgi:hypothetical protein